MRRFFALCLAALLCLSLAACAKQETPDVSDTPDAGDAAAPADPAGEPLAFDALNVEFVAGDRDFDELLTLKSEFPRSLIDALAKQDVEVGAVNVTFGTSDDATAEALRSGAVDIGFLPAEAAIEKGLDIVAIEQGAGADPALSAVVLNRDEIARGLCAALPDLAPVLKHYTGVRYIEQTGAQSGYEAEGGVYVEYADEPALPEHPLVTK